jgi:hypothetical protein
MRASSSSGSGGNIVSGCDVHSSGTRHVLLVNRQEVQFLCPEIDYDPNPCETSVSIYICASVLDCRMTYMYQLGFHNESPIL